MQAAVPARRSGGFSLIEMLAVIVIVGIMATVLLLSSGLGGAQARQQDDARSLVALLSLMCEESVLLSRQQGVSVDDLGLRFVSWDGSIWSDREERTFRARPFTAGTRWILRVNGREVRETDPEIPEIVCYSSGELTPFDLTLEHASGDRVTVSGDATGDISLDVADGT